ncbi:MAG TPA: hypothetical protein VG271_09500 [Beijerinckiaceae bacterium]|nr:hypothetical protein [Beijerinckiaceae bacterium]
MNRRIFLGTTLATTILSILAVPAPGAAPAPPATPLQIVQKIYAVSAGKDGKYHGVSAFENKSIRKLYFSASLLAAIDKGEAYSKKHNEPVIDFDPVLNTQEDPQVKGLDIKVEAETPATSVIAAAFTSYDEKNIVRYDFIKDGTAWKIDDMRGESGTDKWSLRDVIKTGTNS